MKTIEIGTREGKLQVSLKLFALKRCTSSFVFEYSQKKVASLLSAMVHSGHYKVKYIIMKQISFLLLLFGLLLWSCREDSIIDEQTDTTKPQPTEYYETNMIGQVVDEAGVAIIGATVSAGGTTTTTNEFGYFRLNANAPSTGMHLKVTKNGYFVGGAHHVPQVEGEVGSERIVLLEKVFETFATDQEVVIPNGSSSLTIPANAFSKDGSPYEGQVRIAARWLDPESENLDDEMPGDLMAINAAGDQVGLETYGMYAVEMEDMAGNEVQLLDGQTAELFFSLSAELNSTAPETIPLWHFDEQSGIWVEEGTASKSNGGYVANVSHFSWWNCDVPFGSAILCIKIVDNKGNAMDNLRVCITALPQRQFCETLFNTNEHCGLVAAETVLQMEIYDICNNLIYDEEIGPFDEDLVNTNDIGVIIDLPVGYDNVQVTGSVTDCSGDEVTDGAAILVYEGNQYLDLDLANGTYDINFLRCNNATTTVNTKAIDFNASVEGTGSFELIAGTTDYTENLIACGQQVEETRFILDSPTQDFLLGECRALQTAAETMIVGAFGAGAASDCWDTNGNGISDPEEDTNGDGIFNADDCLGGFVIGFKGFSEGSFKGNIIPGTGLQDLGPVDAWEPDQVDIVITRYDAVGGYIQGTFSYDDTTGSFTADRLR